MKARTFLALALACFSSALAQPPKDAKPEKQPEFKAPPGWTEADMQACMEAGAPGPNHQTLAKSIGTWRGKTTMWMAPGAQPITSECATTVTDFMDGRFTKWEMAGDVPGMGAMKGMGLYGFDNLTQKFVATWVTNCGTGIMNGTGALSSDGKTFTWTYNITCPITKKPTTMRDIERHTGPDSITLETWGTDPKGGKEFKMMESTFTRTGAKAAAAIQKVSDRTAEVACSHCVYHMDGANGCELAVKLDGKTYLVDGAKLDTHEWCERSLNAVVSGSVENGRFVASSLKLK
jgi:hypothetical protein